MNDRVEREREFWNAARLTGEQSRRGIAKYYSVAGRRLNAYRELLLNYARQGAQMLELGCSDGAMAVELARAGGVVSAIDISDVAVSRARERAQAHGVSDVAFRVGDATMLPYPSASFDVVYASAVLHHLDIVRVAGEIARVARPSAAGVFLEPLGANPLIAIYRRVTPKARTVDERPLTRDDVRTLSGPWLATDFRYFDFLTLASVPFRTRALGERLRAITERADDVLLRSKAGERLAWFVLLHFEGRAT